MADMARKTSLYILNVLDKGHPTLDRLLDDVLFQHTHISRKDRAFIQALVFGVLRWKKRLDWVIAYFSKTPFDKIDTKVLNILRLGLFQIIYLNKIPVSAAVNTSVEMAKSVSAPYVVRYVNGLLRNAVRDYQKVPFPDIDSDTVTALATQKSFPEWLIERWLVRFGLEETERLCNAINTIPPITVRCNSLLTDRSNLMTVLENDCKRVRSTDFSPEGVFFIHPKNPIPAITAFKSGLFQVQDEAAQLVTFILNPKPGEIVLDACAGLGGKTGHIAQMMKNHGRVIALDKDEKKFIKLNSEMHRLGISIVKTCTHDLTYPLHRENFPKFDRILLDAPCSGLGVLRRNPDTKWRSSKQIFSGLRKKQSLFLGRLSQFVKPRGILVYVVCSMEPEENESVIKEFLNKHTEFAIEKNPAGLPDKARSLVTENGYFKTFPHIHNMDGFFSVCLKRKK